MTIMSLGGNNPIRIRIYNKQINYYIRFYYRNDNMWLSKLGIFSAFLVKYQALNLAINVKEKGRLSKSILECLGPVLHKTI